MNNADFMGKERIFPLLLKLSVPAVISMLVSALYNIVDTIFVGQGVGPRAIAALSIAFPIQIIIGAISQSVGVGAASIISRRLGAKDRETAVATAGTAISSIVLIVLCMNIIIYIFMKPLLVFFGATPSILGYTRDYMMFITAGFFFFAFTAGTGCLVRAEGNTRVAMTGMLVGMVLNMLLDPLFIFVFHMGIKGAALATLISQFFAAVYMLLFYLRGKSILKLEIRHLRINVRLLGESLVLGVPNFVRMAGTSIIFTLVNNILGRLGGDFAISTYGMVHRLFSFIIMPLMGIAQGFQPAAGYNYGAQDYTRVREILLKGIVMASCVGMAGFALMRFFPGTLLRMFTSDSALVESSAGALKIIVLGVPVLGLQFISASYFQAIGRKVMAIVLNILRQYIFLIPLLIVLPLFLDIRGVWMAIPLTEALATVVTVVILFSEAHRLGENGGTLPAEQGRETAE